MDNSGKPLELIHHIHQLRFLISVAPKPEVDTPKRKIIFHDSSPKNLKTSPELTFDTSGIVSFIFSKRISVSRTVKLPSASIYKIFFSTSEKAGFNIYRTSISKSIYIKVFT